MSYQPPPQDKDSKLWHLAQKRASFKSHLTTYIIMNLFFWILWYFTGAGTTDLGIPWPVWPMLGWGIGVAFHYTSAYVTTDADPIEREYEKLINEKNNKNSSL